MRLQSRDIVARNGAKTFVGERTLSGSEQRYQHKQAEFETKKDHIDLRPKLLLGIWIGYMVWIG